MWEKIKKSLLAGMLIGMGVVANTSVENRYLGAALFSLGLITIIQYQAWLFTGKIGYVFDRQYNIKDYIIMLVANCVGAVLVVDAGILARPAMVDEILAVSSAKYDKLFASLLFSGMLCGACVYIAVSVKHIFVTLMAVTVFIICGFEHCIADIPYLLCRRDITFIMILKWLTIVVGNSVGALIMHSLYRSKIKEENDMRSKERLDVFYDELKQIHKDEFQDWRFGQFCSNFFGWLYSTKGIDLFFPEEDDMIKYIKEYAKEIKNEN